MIDSGLLLDTFAFSSLPMPSESLKKAGKPLVSDFDTQAIRPMSTPSQPACRPL
uniref:Uncharacterized protein n=1 Tax=Pseudomonas fluorescens (strain SBW25) TaxID=216595 RepID=A0A0G4E6C0_PSEFS|nr:hypothetical protein PQBR55_0113 [Pseudomonas fluorescens SBW25]